MDIIIFNGIIVVVSCFFLYITTTFPHPHALEGQLLADFWPKIILIGLLVTSSFLTIWGIIVRKKEAYEKTKHDGEKNVAVKQTNTQRLILTILMTVLYVYLLKIFGFAFLTLIFLFFFLYNMGLRKKILLVILPLSITAITIFIFTHAMTVILPRGSGIFRRISLLFY